MLEHYWARYYNVGALLSQILQCWSITEPYITMLEHYWARYYNVGALLGQILQKSAELVKGCNRTEISTSTLDVREHVM